MTAPFLRSTTASSPLKLMTAFADQVGLVEDRQRGRSCAATNTSPAAMVPVRATLWLTVGEPLLYSSSV
jgi:hypothetical protein